MTPHTTRSSLIFGSLILLLAGCGQAPQGERTMIVLLGRSSSERLQEQPALLQQTLRSWFERVQMTGHGKYEVALVGRGIDDTPVLFSAVYPAAFPAPVTRHRAAWFDSVSKALTAAADSLPSERGSAIIEGLFRIARRLPTGVGDSAILVLGSDLRQVTPGQWNFERATPEPQLFLDWIEANGLTPPIRPTVSVTVCGFHMDTPGATSRMTAANYAKIERVWQEALGTWVRRYRLAESCTQDDVIAS